LKTALIDYLACVACNGELGCKVRREDRTLPWREIVEGRLVCEKCGREYPVQGGVPRMMPETVPKKVQATIDGFGWEWQNFDECIQDTYMTGRKNFLDFIYPVKEGFFEGKCILDAGCGMGRFLRLGAEFGSRQIIGMDLSSSVETAYRHTRQLPNAHVVQGDILAPPFKATFDYVFSVGVLQFMVDPKKGFASLVRCLKGGGAISVWVYSRENNGWAMRLLSPFREHLTSRLPRRALFFLSCFFGALQYACVNLLYKPLNENRAASNLKRLLPYNEYLYHSSRLTYFSLVSVIFDHLAPRITSYISKNELENWYLEEGVSVIKITSRNNMSWCAFGFLEQNASEQDLGCKSPVSPG
jgi:SAM-dependent methyltransferase